MPLDPNDFRAFGARSQTNYFKLVTPLIQIELQSRSNEDIPFLLTT